MNEFLKKIQAGETLSRAEMIRAMTTIMEGQASEIETAAFLMGLSVRGETVEELTGAATVMRGKALAIRAPADAVDCCGTGGDKSGTYNISTAVALVAAACGVPVAKHGNRAASSKSGAADVLEALGVHLDLPPEQLEEALRRLHFAFLMAPRHHAAMKHVVPVRKALGVRTIFNLLGPLANPAGARRQLIGVFDAKWLAPMAETLRGLGAERAWVVHGSDGLDEITVTGPTEIAILESGMITRKILRPEDFGLERGDPDDLKGGSAEENARALQKLLEGAPGAYRDIVLANTAAVLAIHGSAPDLKAGVRQAMEAIDSGRALETLRRYAAFSMEAA